MSANIEYLYTEGINPSDLKQIPVRLDGIRVGNIKRVKGGWQYFPLKHKIGGEIYRTLSEVQRSLQSDVFEI